MPVLSSFPPHGSGAAADLVFGSVCSGIEAASVAWLPLGWRCSFVSEIDTFASAVLAHRFPEVPNLGDFTQIGDDVGAIDVLVGGTPCQSFSVAGSRAGLDDPRGNLAVEFCRLARRLRPTWVVWENVPGVLSSWSDAEEDPAGGVWQTNDFDTFLSLLAQCGYGCAWRILDAQYFGVAQRRRRVFVVGCLGNWQAAAAVLFERHSLSGHPAPRRETRASIASALTKSLGVGGPDDNHVQGNWLIPALAHCLTGDDGHRQDGTANTYLPAVAHTLRADGFDASEDGTGRGTPLVPVSVNLRGREGGTTAEMGDQVMTALRTGGDGSDKPHVLAFDWQAAGAGEDTSFRGGSRKWIVRAGEYTGALGATRRDAVAIAETQPAVMSDLAVRRLTPRECERLQGFPDDFTLVPYRGKPAADGPRYKAIGNSMAVPVMRWIGQRIALVHRLLAEAS